VEFVPIGECLYPLIEDAKPLENILEKFSIDYESEYLIMMQNKLGLQDKKESDFFSWLGRIIGKSRNRYDIFFKFGTVSKDDSVTIAFNAIIFYNEKDLNENVMKEWYDWLERYSIRINEEKL
jgi:uncharacterized protein YdiU (UPF0061 family)